jgi:putative hemolysin
MNPEATDTSLLLEKVIGPLLADQRIQIRSGPNRSIPATGAAIVVVNRLLGGPDPLIVLAALWAVRADIVVYGHEDLIEVNALHGVVNCLIDQGSSEDLQDAFEQVIGSGALLVLFPSKQGRMSRLTGGMALDKRWEVDVINAIHGLECPIIPIYLQTEAYLKLIHSSNFSFDRLTAYFGQLAGRDKQIDVIMGRPVSPDVWHRFTSDEQLARYLRARLYALGSAMEPDLFFIPKGIAGSASADAPPMPVMAQGDMELVAAEMMRLPVLVEQGEYTVHLADARAIPNALKEIGRLRELTFRTVGEGTGKETDLDEYDLHYDHLILWDRKEKQIAGCYRIGFGDAIMSRFGRRGFYVRSLFRLSKRLNPYLMQSIELGRSFVCPEYQRGRLPLFMLWRGILLILQQRPQFRYVIGPVSISNRYSKVSRQLMVSYVLKHHWDAQLAQYVRPRKAFRPSKATDVDVDALIDAEGNELSSIDGLIAEIEPGHVRMPVLLKRYMAQEARIIGFNVDPKFSGALDGLMILDIRKIPGATWANLKADLE